MVGIRLFFGLVVHDLTFCGGWLARGHLIKRIFRVVRLHFDRLAAARPDLEVVQLAISARLDVGLLLLRERLLLRTAAVGLGLHLFPLDLHDPVKLRPVHARGHDLRPVPILPPAQLRLFLVREQVVTGELMLCQDHFLALFASKEV